MIQAKNCDNFSKFVEVTEKNTIGPFFWTRVFLYALPANVPSELRHPADPQESHDKKRSSTTKGTLYTTHPRFPKFTATLAPVVAVFFIRHIFITRRVCIAQTMPSKDVCPSVRLSHAGILSKRLHIFPKSFSPSGSTTILVFRNETGWQYSDGDPLMWASNSWGV